MAQTVRIHAHPESIISALTFSPDGRFLASSGDNRSVQLWDATTGEERGTLQPSSDSAYGADSLAFSPDGVLLAGRQFSHANTLSVWNVTGQTTVFQKTVQGELNAVFSPDGNYLACVDHTLSLLNPTTGMLEKELLGHPHPEWILNLCWHSNGQYLASGDEDMGSSIRVWDVNAGQQRGFFLSTREGYAQNIECLSFSLEDSVVFVNDSLQPQIWPWQSGGKPYPIPHGLQLPVQYPTVLSSDGRYAACIDQDDYYLLHIVDLVSGQHAIMDSPHGHDEVVSRVVFSPNNKQIATGDFEGVICIWTLPSL